jgi:hypothetical protein
MIPDIRIVDIEMSIRLENCLLSRGWHKLADLDDKTEKDMLQIRNFGKGCLRELYTILRAFDVGIGREPVSQFLRENRWVRFRDHPLLDRLTLDDRRQLFRDLMREEPVEDDETIARS